MIRVLNIISDTNIGGAGRVLLNYLKYEDRDRFTASVAVPRGSALLEPLKKLGTTVYEVDGIADRSLDMKAVKTLRGVIRQADPQIVHTHGALSGRIAGRREGRTVIYTRHSAFPVKSYLKKGPGRLLNKLINEHYADRIIAISPAAAENLTDGGVSRERIDVIMNGVEPVRGLAPEERTAYRESLGVGETEFLVGILARIEDYKGHITILEALRKLRDRGRPVRLLIAGTGSFEETVRQKTQELALTEDVIFTGFVEDVAPVLSAMEVQLNASWGTETSCLSVLEGFSIGLPAVVSDYGGNPWLVDEGVNGFLFPTKDSGALAERLARCMDDRARLTAMGEGAKRIYRERFTGEIFARNVEAIYTKTLEGANHGK